MPSEIASELLTQAKNQLISGDFENAAKSARGLLALDDQNEVAREILTAAEAVVGQVSDRVTVVEQEELKAVAEKVQIALNNKKMLQAEEMIREFVEEHPVNLNAQQILTQVQVARSEHTASMQRAAEKNAELRTRLSASGYGGDESGRRRDMISRKSIIAALVLCLLLGSIGAHRFYAGKTGSGILMMLTFGLLGIWTLVDLVVIATGNFVDGEGAKIKA